MTEHDILKKYLEDNSIRHSAPRQKVIDVFLATEKHVTVQELFLLVKKKFPAIGIATVYRAVKIACDAGLAREVDFGEGVLRYEHLWGHEHHDHLICIKCGAFHEIQSDKIEQEQNRIANQFGYELVRHRHFLYGVCPQCKV